jgi:glycolate oxidase iron-sulfur subunit
MQTNFQPEQLADPRIAEVDRILRRCVHCGLCTATCSTYVLLGDERDSPRGRIYLVKEMFEKGGKPSTEIQHHVDRCLSCLSCMTTCPGGVDYMHLVDHARAHIEEQGHRPPKERFVRRLLAATVPYPGRFKWAIALAPLCRPFIGLMRRLGLGSLAAMIELAPGTPVARSATYRGAGIAATKKERRAHVILLAGCAQQVLRPEINDSTIRLLAEKGIDVEVAAGAGCCGALVHHMGREREAIRQAKANVDAWTKVLDRGDRIDAIVVNASGCGTMVKDYGHLLAHDPDYKEKAERIAALAKDVTELLTEYPLGPPSRWSSLRVAYHSACSMQHGQRITEEPKELLYTAGYTVMDVPEGHICCGSAGVYNILQPDLAGRLLERKVDNIRKTNPDLVATGNLGCITQLERGTSTPVIHTIELLDWAYGGPVPRGLEAYMDFVKDVPGPNPQVKRKPEDFVLE